MSASSRRGPVGVAVVGADNISKQYSDNLTVFPDMKVVVIADHLEDTAALLNQLDDQNHRPPHYPGGACGRGRFRRQRRQARVDREAVLAGPQLRAGAAQGSWRRGAPARHGPGHSGIW
jgi:hypothetical protein